MRLTNNLKSMHCPKCQALIPVHANKCKYCQAHIINLVDTYPVGGETVYVKLAVNHGGQIMFVDFATNLFTDTNYQIGYDDYHQLSLAFGFQPTLTTKDGEPIYRISPNP